MSAISIIRDTYYKWIRTLDLFGYIINHNKRFIDTSLKMNLIEAFKTNLKVVVKIRQKSKSDKVNSTKMGLTGLHDFHHVY